MISPDQFVSFLAAYVELNPGVPPTPAQWAIINAKLDSCFNKVTPDRSVMPASEVRESILPITGGSAADREAGYQAALARSYTGLLKGTGDMNVIRGLFNSITC